MNIKELQNALRLLEAMYASGGARKQAESVSTLIEALEGHHEQSVEAFVEGARHLNDDSLRIPSKAKAINGEAVSRHVDSLFAAGVARDRFDAAFVALKSDPLAKIGECVEVANIYKNRPTNGTFKYKFESRTKALDFIFDTYLGRAQDESKAGIIDKLAKWATG